MKNIIVVTDNGKSNITMADMERRIDEIIEDKYYSDKIRENTFRIARCNEGLEDIVDLYEISKAKHPQEKFYNSLGTTEFIQKTDYYAPELIDECIVPNLSKEELVFYANNTYEIWDYIDEKYFWEYDIEEWNDYVRVNIMLDIGNANYDFYCDNVLNWYGSGGNGSFEKESSTLWLARQQGKEEELREACREIFNPDSNYFDRKTCEDGFVESCIQELENLPTSMGTITFLVTMPFLDFLHLRDKMAEDENENSASKLSDRTGEGYITISQNAECGLFDAWNGSGSVLAIDLVKPVELPIKCIYDAEIETGKSVHGYSVDSVYGLTPEAWRGRVTLNYATEEKGVA